MPKVSVCVPIYKVEKYIERCARSLFEQTLDDIEYIFVNDCTPDKSVEALQRVLEEYPHRKEQVRIIDHEKNQGLAAARTTAMKHVQGEYVAHCDSDDWVEKDMYEVMYNKAKSENADIVCCSSIWEYPNKQITISYPYSEETKMFLQKNGLVHYMIWDKLIRTSLYKDNRIEWFEGINHGEDIGIVPRLSFLSRKTVVLSPSYAPYHYNKLNESALTWNISSTSINQRIQCIRLLEDWFAEHFDKTEYEQTIVKLKLGIKVGFLANLSIDEFKRTYPEMNENLWQYPTLALSTRLIVWLALHHCAWLAWALYTIQRQIKKLLPYYKN